MMTVVMFLRPGVLSVRYTAGSAKPGRGARRKRKALASASRTRARAEVLLAAACVLLMPNKVVRMVCAESNPEPTTMPGRRERRRRAKLRRRRERAAARVTWREEMAALVDRPVSWEPAVTGWQPLDAGEVYRY